MALKLTIGDVIDVPVKGSVKDGGKDVDFRFTLQARRISTEAYREQFGSESELTKREVLEQHITGWKGQRLVVDEDDQPAPFSSEAFGLLMSVVGMEDTILMSYLKALQISETGPGRAKN